MAEGGGVPIDETTEKTPLIPDDTGDDADDGIDWEAPVVLDPEEPDRTQPFEPGGASTPYPEGEEYEMTRLPQEQSGGGETIPEAPEVTDFVAKPTLIERFREIIKGRFPKVDLSKIPLGLGTKKGLKGKVVALGQEPGKFPFSRRTETSQKRLQTSLGLF